MSELKFPLYFTLGKMYFKWSDTNTYIKSHAPFSGFQWGISKVSAGSITLGDWLERNPIATPLSHEEYTHHISTLLEEVRS